MKLAFSKATADAAEAARMVERFAGAGFDGLQLKPNQYIEFLDEPAKFLDSVGRRPGAASALIAAGTIDPLGAAKLRRIFRFAATVGSERIVFCHCVGREGLSDDEIRRFAGELSDLGDEAAGVGVALSLHHHFNQPLMHRGDFDTFFDTARRGAVGLTVDTAHLAKSGVADIAGLVRDMAEVIDNFHMKDFADNQFRLLGSGTLDFAAIFAAIRDIGYDGWISADEESGAELESALAQCREFMRRHLAAAKD